MPVDNLLMTHMEEVPLEDTESSKNQIVVGNIGSSFARLNEYYQLTYSVVKEGRRLESSCLGMEEKYLETSWHP